MIKAAERAGVRSSLRVKAGTSTKARATVKTRRPMESVAVAKIAVMETLVAELMAMRNKGVMVEERSAAVPVISPVAPAPPKSSEEADAKSNSKAKADAAPKNPGHRIPAWIGDDWVAIYQPRIIGRHIDNLRISRLDDDRVSLFGDPFLVSAIQMAGFLSLLAHLLDSIGDILRVVDIGLAER